MRKILFLACILGMRCLLSAQDNRTSWSNLSVLHPGQRVQIVEINLTKHSGTFVNFSDTALSYHQPAGEQTLRKEDVKSVKLTERHRLRNTLIGGAVGAGAGAGVVAGSWEDRGYLGGKGVGAEVGAAFGFIGGAIVGALLPNHRMIYSAN
jgi:hypothetical protein